MKKLQTYNVKVHIKNNYKRKKKKDRWTNKKCLERTRHQNTDGD